MNSEQQRIQLNIIKSYNPDQIQEELSANLEKGVISEELFCNASQEVDLMKGGKKALVGEKRVFGGREYIKTNDGWKFHGKGTGTKAQQHVSSNIETPTPLPSVELPEYLKTDYPVIDHTISESMSMINQSIETAIANQHKKETEQGRALSSFSERDREAMRLTMTYKIARALGKFIEKTDKPVTSSIRFGNQGIQGTIVIDRDGEKHTIETRSIVARGEINVAHYRYIANSSLKNRSDAAIKDTTVKLDNETKRRSKEDSLLSLLRGYNKQIADVQEKISSLEKVTEEDFIATKKLEMTTKYPFDPSKYTTDAAPGAVHKDIETYNAWIDENAKNWWQLRKNDLPYQKNRLKSLMQEKVRTEAKLKLLSNQ